MHRPAEGQRAWRVFFFFSLGLSVLTLRRVRSLSVSAALFGVGCQTPVVSLGVLHVTDS